MTSIFNDRLEGRFLKPIRLIECDQHISNFSGFSILALDCLIIETLRQFYDGTDESKNVGNSFINFLTNSEFFKTCFSKATAQIFYRHFRNGLLHQAQTKKKSLIRIGQKSMVVKVNDGLIVDRKLFHSGIEDEINQYQHRLHDSENKDLRENFIKKMNYICNLQNS